MSTRRVLALCLALSGSVLVGAMAAGAVIEGRGGESTPPDPAELQGMHEMPTDLHGTVVIGWQAAGGPREHEIEISSHGGAVVARYGDQLAMGGSDGRWLRRAADWLALSVSDSRDRLPAAGAKYELDVHSDDRVAGRRATVVEATVRGEDEPAQRIAIDDELGFVLARTWYDPGGQTTRWVRFLEVDSGSVAADDRVVPEDVTGAPEWRSDISDPYTDPATLPRGFVLVGAYEHPGGLVHLHYSDGLESVSVFEQYGRLDLTEMPNDYVTAQIGGASGYSWVGPAGRVLVWEHEGIVYTLVGNAARPVLAELAADVDDRHESILDRLTATLLEPIGL